MTDQLPRQLRAILLPTEQVLWTGSPDLIYIKRTIFWNRVGTVGLIIIVILALIQVGMTQRYPERSFFDWIGTGNSYLAVASGVIFAVCVAVGWRQQLKDEPYLAAEPPQIIFVLTNSRVLFCEPHTFYTGLLLLTDTQVVLKRHRKAYGDVRFYPAGGPYTKRQLAQFLPVFTFAYLHNAAEVYQRIIDAQNRLSPNP